MKPKSINWFKVRIFLISFLLSICFVLIVIRMFQLQVLKKEKLYRMATQQQHVQIPLVPKRGIIYDQKGNELAVSIEVESVFADPRSIKNLEKTVQELSPILQIDRKELKQVLKSRRSFEWIQRKITFKESEQVKALRLPGIHFLKENQRFYPNATLAAHLIGFVSLDSKGLEGMEFQYDHLLNGKKNMWVMGRDALGREIAEGDGPFREEDHQRHITLTLDKQIQHVAETELNQAVQKWRAKGGMIIAMDPVSGKVLAMATSPSFNPNQFLQYRPKTWRNEAITDTFEPGSLLKTFLAAAALEEKVVRPLDSFYCENGSYKVYDRTIHDHSKHGWLTFQQIIKFSSNIGASKVGEKLGKDRFYKYICAFGFGDKTRIGLPGESKGILRHPRYWSPITLDTVSFGQGISVTGIQLATALCAIANGGMLMKPYVVERITNEKGGVVQSFEPEVVRKVISGETAKTVSAMLRTATEKGGTGEWAVPPGYIVAGKTGTAQKADGLLGGYAEDRYMSGFMGFAPAEEPRIVLLVVIDEPQGNNYGGVVAAPVFKAVMEKVLPYLNVHPTGTVIVKNEIDSSSTNESLTSGPMIEEGNIGKVDAKEVMPDLTGLPIRTALTRIEGKGLIIKVSGKGKVVEQVPKPGVIFEKGEFCFLKLQPPS
jgi:cell division protein FtsI (penicillin-binding protein 3)